MSDYDWIADGVFIVRNFLSGSECDRLVAMSESIGYTAAPIESALGPLMRKDIRSNDRLIVDDPQRACAWWTLAYDYVPMNHRHRIAVGFNERLRFYRYDPGQQFDWHRDGSFERLSGERSFFTLLIYLNEGFVGGETSFGDAIAGCDRTIDIVPATGLALFFEHRLLHKGQPVQSGRKYVVRSDIMYGPPRHKS